MQISSNLRINQLKFTAIHTSQTYVSVWISYAKFISQI
jgi:hypothetical protein